MAGHPLRPANHLSLGGPLPHQLANGAQADPGTIACKQRPSFTAEAGASAVVSGISQSFDWLSRTPGYVTYVLLTRAPVYSGAEAPFLPRLACVRHAASVRSEPGSNSPVNSGVADALLIIDHKKLNYGRIRLRKKYAVHCATSPQFGIEVRHYLVFKDRTRTGVNAPYSQKAVALSTASGPLTPRSETAAPDAFQPRLGDRLKRQFARDNARLARRYR